MEGIGGYKKGIFKIVTMQYKKYYSIRFCVTSGVGRPLHVTPAQNNCR